MLLGQGDDDEDFTTPPLNFQSTKPPLLLLPIQVYVFGKKCTLKLTLESRWFFCVCSSSFFFQANYWLGKLHIDDNQDRKVVGHITSSLL